MEALNIADPRRVLAVDDEPRSLRVVARLLEQAQLYCHTASTPETALAFLEEARDVDVVVSDLRMPGMDGIEFLRSLRRTYVDRPWLQLILVSGQASLEAAIAAIRIEASDFLFKPIDPKRLRESVRNALDRATKARHALDRAPAGNDGVRELEDTARMLALKLNSLTAAGEARCSESALSDGREAIAVISRLRDTRQSIFGSTLVPEPAWEMLVELMRASICGTRLSVTSLCLSSQSPTTTALRKIEELADAGLVRRVPDQKDGRRSYVELTADGVLRMRTFLEAFTHTMTRTQRTHADA